VHGFVCVECRVLVFSLCVCAFVEHVSAPDAPRANPGSQILNTTVDQHTVVAVVVGGAGGGLAPGAYYTRPLFGPTLHTFRG